MCGSCSTPVPPADSNGSDRYDDGSPSPWSRRTFFGLGAGATAAVAGLAGTTPAYAAGTAAMNGDWCNPALGYFPTGGHYGAPRGNYGHEGQDVTNNVGTGVYAAAAGTVIRRSWGGGLAGRTGEALVISHGNNVYSFYGHLSAYHVGLDASVSAGQLIADMGATGNVTGPHLHFETHTGGLSSTGTSTDPVPFMSGRGVDLGGGWPRIDPEANGERVKSIQHLMNQRGADLEIDGYYGPVSVDVVQEFQSDQGLVADGQVGPETWPEIVYGLDTGSSDGSHVRGLQEAMNKRSAGVLVDGNFGPVMDSAVRDYQSLNRLVVDGYAGPVTWQALVG